MQVDGGQATRPGEPTAVDAGPRGPDGAGRRSGGMLFSVALHAAILLGGALAMPPLGPTDAEREAPPYLLVPVLAAVAEREPQTWPARQIAEQNPDDEEPADSRCADLHGGMMGEPSSLAREKRYAVKGPRDNPDPHLARDRMLAHDWPYLGLFLTPGGWGGDDDSPRAPWARDDALGTEPESARGAFFADAIGFAYGAPGVGIGLPRLCETCGHTGNGRADEVPTAPGGAVGTAPYHVAIQRAP